MTIHNDQMPPEVHTKCWPVNQVDRLPAKLSSAVCHSQHVTTIVPKLTMSHTMEAFSNILLMEKLSNFAHLREFSRGTSHSVCNSIFH